MGLVLGLVLLNIPVSAADNGMEHTPGSCQQQELRGVLGRWMEGMSPTGTSAAWGGGPGTLRKAQQGQMHVEHDLAMRTRSLESQTHPASKEVWPAGQGK